MDARTRSAYESNAAAWSSARRPKAIEDGRLASFARRLRRRGRVADLGCGPGWYAARLRALGHRAIALDAARAMLDEVGRREPSLPRVCADLLHLPFRDRSLDAAWAVNCYQHVPAGDLPLALARLHGTLRPGAPIELTMASLDHANPTKIERNRGEAQRRFEGDEFRGRLFTLMSEGRLRDLLDGAGFDRVRIDALRNPFWLRARARRARSLADLVGPDLCLLVCGLNPSLYSADSGVPFARSGNRFWAAARLAGLIVRERDPLAAFARGIGFTDLVKRATGGADELEGNEYTAGLGRVERLARLHRPGVVCFVGLDGWRRAIDRKAMPGWIGGGFGGRPAYLMPSTSGRNARVSLAILACHLRRAARGR
jgi:TDG/mug DNA glycosylase family protein